MGHESYIIQNFATVRLWKFKTLFQPSSLLALIASPAMIQPDDMCRVLWCTFVIKDGAAVPSVVFCWYQFSTAQKSITSSQLPAFNPRNCRNCSSKVSRSNR